VNRDGVRYAGFWQRLAALLIDSTLLGVFLTLVLLAKTQIVNLESLALLSVGVLFPPAFFLLTVYLNYRMQGTPGRLLMDCRIVDARTGQHMRFRQSLWRTLALFISALPAFLGFLWIARDKRKQGFHDKLAGTVVLIEDESQKSLMELVREAQ
jgi:uncharacterized RDD family membrane protein YckC